MNDACVLNNNLVEVKEEVNALSNDFDIEVKCSSSIENHHDESSIGNHHDESSIGNHHDESFPENSENHHDESFPEISDTTATEQKVGYHVF